LIIDSHCHVIVPEMTARSVPEAWRPSLRTQDGRRLVGFRGRELTSAVGEFSDVAVMLGDAATTGVDHLLLSPWINLVPVDAGPDEARLVCQVQNEALARLAADHPGRLSALGAVPVQDPGLAGKELAGLMTVPGLHGVEIPSSVGGRYLGDDFFLPFWEAAAESGALVFIHPSTRGFGIPALDGYYLWNSVGNPLETAITAAHIAVAGVLERFPGLRILLAHGGGAGGSAAPTASGPRPRSASARVPTSRCAGSATTRSPTTRACWPTWSSTPARSRCCSARTGPSTWALTIPSTRCARCGSEPGKTSSSAGTPGACWAWPVTEPRREPSA
jgi:aminocarboxymuconate-semialdehyde decarboxylase